MHYLHTGCWIQESMRPNLVEEKTFHGWNDFFNYSTHYFNGPNNFLCDCFRRDVVKGRRASIDRTTIFENHYYYDSCRDNLITYSAKFGATPFRGHWQPQALPFSISLDATALHDSPFLWTYNTWSDMIQYHLANLQPKPQFVVINAGLWANHGLNEIVLSSIRQTLDDVGMIGIYKTTTKAANDITGPLRNHDNFGCRLLHYCLLYNWTAQLSQMHYWDRLHFRAHVNNRFNDELLEIIKMIQHEKPITSLHSP
jgi:hypothetical protein